jgi:hypothetical protein
MLRFVSLAAEFFLFLIVLKSRQLSFDKISLRRSDCTGIAVLD